MLPKVDGYSKWREKESAELSDLVQRRIAFLQTPSDCSNARKLVCNLNKVFFISMFHNFFVLFDVEIFIVV